MTVEFRCIGDSYNAEPGRGSLRGADDEVFISTEDSHHVVIHRASFISAVESELNVRVVPADAIVIERSELPRIAKARGASVDMDNGDILELDSDEIPDTARRWGLNWLAIAEHLTANPPVDEAQVAKIVISLTAEDRSLGRHLGTTEAQYDEIARSLYRAGVRVVTS